MWAIPRAQRGPRRKFDLGLRPNFAGIIKTKIASLNFRHRGTFAIEPKIITGNLHHAVFAYATKLPNDEPRRAEAADNGGLARRDARLNRANFAEALFGILPQAR